MDIKVGDVLKVSVWPPEPEPLIIHALVIEKLEKGFKILSVGQRGHVEEEVLSDRDIKLNHIEIVKDFDLGPFNKYVGDRMVMAANMLARAQKEMDDVRMRYQVLAIAQSTHQAAPHT